MHLSIHYSGSKIEDYLAEASALIYVILYFRVVLWGQHFILETDHRNLTYIHRWTSPKVLRMSMVMQNFGNVPGVDISIPDAMSRAPRALLTIYLIRMVMMTLSNHN